MPFLPLSAAVGMIVHDMNLHALGIHAVPAGGWEELVAQAAEIVRRRFWVLPRLADFFEAPVTKLCWDIWRDIDEPDDFAPAFETRFHDLKVQLQQI